MKSFCSQNDIARLTGLSRSTVSRALSNYRHTSEETKKIVLKAAQKLGYQKNPIVSTLTAQIRKSRIAPSVSTLAYITSLPPDFPTGEDFRNYREYYAGVKAQAEKMGYKLDVLWRKEPGMTRERFDKILQSRNIQGAIIAPRPHAYGHLAMNYSRLALAAVGHSLPSPSISVASPWHFYNMSLTLRQLVKLKFRRLGYAMDPLTDMYTDFSFSSRFLLYQSQIPTRDRVPMLAKPRTHWTPDLHRFEAWLDKYKPDVILCAGHVIPSMISELGLKVPEDISYVDLMQPAEESISTGINERPHEVGAAAVDMVIAMLHNNETGIPDAPRRVHIPGSWRDGSTIAPQK